jgi:hypothetical protein
MEKEGRIRATNTLRQPGSRVSFHAATQRRRPHSTQADGLSGGVRGALQMLFLHCHATVVGLFLGNIPQQDVAQRDQAFEFFAIHNRDVSEAEFPH